MAGSTLGPAGAAIGTGHSSLAGYNGALTGSSHLTGSAHNLHTAANLNSNGALAARGNYSNSYIYLFNCSNFDILIFIELFKFKWNGVLFN